MLWLEFDAPPLDPEDAYFVRVLTNAPTDADRRADP